MSTLQSAPPFLIALRNGLSPYAEPMLCEDATGAYSIFGERVLLPPPVEPAEVRVCAFFGRQFFKSRPVLLWYEDLLAADTDFAVPATTFLCGVSTSTFDVAWRLTEEGHMPPWGAALCSAQTAGRGQMRRHWHSPRGNLHVSFRLPVDTLLSGDAASLATGFIIARALNDLGFVVSLKWPNDVLDANGRKVGGLLLEERGGILMAGLGVNLVEAPSPAMLRSAEAVPAGVLADAEGDIPSPFSLWRDLAAAAMGVYEREVAGRSFRELLAAMEPLLAWKGRRVKVAVSEGVELTGECLGVGPHGGLLLRLPGNEEQELFSGGMVPAAE